MVMGDSFTVRHAQGRLLIRPSARTIRWASFVVVAGAGVLVVSAGGREGGDPAAVALPIATTLMCVWLCFLFEDLVAETTDASATPLMFRRAVRAAIAVPSIAAVWFAYTWIGPLAGPTAAMIGAFGAAIALTLAAAAVGVRLFGSGKSGSASAAAVVFVLLVMPVAIRRPASIDPTQPPFGDAFTYWSAVALTSCAVLALVHVDRFQRR
jgi:hypothetical protein